MRIQGRPASTIFVMTMSLVGCAADAAPEDGDEQTGVPSTTLDPGAESSSSGSSGPATTADPTHETAPMTTSDEESTAYADPPVVWDVNQTTDVPQSTCGAPTAIPCDGGSDDPWHAIGLNCNIGPQTEDEQINGDPLSFHIHEGNLGTFEPAPFPPREGEKMLIMSSGHAIDMAVPVGNPPFASNDIIGFVDNGGNPPAPIVVTAVSPTDDCATDPGLVGTGDCSNTIEEQWNQGSGAFDYVEMRFTTEVPFETYSFSYDLAFFSTEYPVFYQSGFNDMYIGWLESELWTGNISFDEMGRPISLNAGFLDYKDAPNDFDCPNPCAAPELQGTGMASHAGTKWLTTTAGVTPGEEITVVFAVFDLSDPILDSVVLLDNFQWGCEGGAPVTIPG
jgi:hypothetical protein